MAGNEIGVILFLVISFLSWISNLSKSRKKGQKENATAQKRRNNPFPTQPQKPRVQRPNPVRRPSESLAVADDPEEFEDILEAVPERSSVRADAELQNLLMSHLKKQVDPVPPAEVRTEIPVKPTAKRTEKPAGKPVEKSRPHAGMLPRIAEEPSVVSNTEDLEISAQGIAAAMQNPQQVRQAMILSEVMTRRGFSQRGR